MVRYNNKESNSQNYPSNCFVDSLLGNLEGMDNLQVWKPKENVSQQDEIPLHMEYSSCCTENVSNNLVFKTHGIIYVIQLKG